MNPIGRIIETEYRYVQWIIQDFNLQSLEDNEEGHSSAFYCLNVSWCVRLFLHGATSDESTEYIGLDLVREESLSDVGEKTVCFTFGLKASDGTQYKSQTTTHSFAAPGDYYGCSKLVKKEEFLREKKKLWPDNDMIIFCEMDGECLVPAESDFTILCPAFKNLVSSGKEADVTIKVKHKKYCVHSEILAAQSPVFASMLRHETNEQMFDTIHIPNCDPTTFKVLLIFLYSGQPDGLSAENARQLYIAADKFKIINLKKNCVDVMCQNMSEQDVCDVLSLGVMHNEKDLLAHGTEFFLNNTEKVLKTAKWMTFFKEHLVEANELIIKVVKYLSDK